jgi:hypothetical protein
LYDEAIVNIQKVEGKKGIRKESYGKFQNLGTCIDDRLCYHNAADVRMYTKSVARIRHSS